MSDAPIRSVIVVGGGVVGLSAAAAFARALPGVTVTVIETPLDPAALTDRLPGSQPSIARFHGLIGLEEADLIASGAATWRIGTRFRNWSASGADWIHFAGQCGPRAGTVAFHHLWARAMRSEGALPYHAYAAAGVLAETGRFVHPVDDPASPFARYDYALRIVPERYRESLARRCDQLGVSRSGGVLANVEIDDIGAVAAIALADGRRLSGDLYVDCAGPAAPLLSRVGADFEDWSAFLPRCRAVIDPADGVAAAADVVERTPEGWRWYAPGAGSGRILRADEAAPGSVVVHPGRQRAPWRRNVVAIGDGAAMLDPLGWPGLALAHKAIELALELLPDRHFRPVELAEYNRRVAADVLDARDFAALLYHCPGGPRSPFWDAAAALTVPDTLSAVVEGFDRRGAFTPPGEAGLDDIGWVAALIGTGHIPRQLDALAAAIPEAAADDAMRRWAEGIDAIAAQLPDYDAYLANTLQRLRGQLP